MGFHTTYAELIKSEITFVKKIALLGDQEVIDDSGRCTSFRDYFENQKNWEVDIFEHPKYRSFKNFGKHIKLDLARIDPKELDVYDCVVDGGTLEHVSNFVHPFVTFWSKLKLGGIFILSYPINNLVDHGYWLPQPRFFWDFFLANGGCCERFEIFQHPISGFTLSELIRVPYSPQPPETMSQPSYLNPNMTAGLFLIAKKRQTHRSIILPSESIR